MEALFDALSVRRAVPEDIPFIARMIREACLSHLDHCAFDDLVFGLSKGEDDLGCCGLMEGVLRSGVSAWGSLEDAFILEEDGKPQASSFLYTPNPEEYRPIHMAKLQLLADELGWSEAQADVFRSRFEELFGPEPCSHVFAPQAEQIIEYVAVVPEARGRGLIKFLLRSIISKAKAQGMPDLGIMIINGNDHALHVYESFGFKPYSAYFEEFFADISPGFPGITRLRLRFNAAGR